MGGKWRQGPKIAEVITPYLKPGDRYVEPFCGAMGSASRVAERSPGLKMELSDVNPALIRTWQAALFEGWIPPDVVTEEEYRWYKDVRDPDDPMTAYVGYGMSFGGKWFGGYARNGRGTNYAINAKRSLLLKASLLLRACNYEDVTGPGVYYLDPPYAGRTKAHGVDFDSGRFWDYTRERVGEATVFITEFTAPDDFVPIYSFGDTVVRHYAGRVSDGTAERIFMHRSQI